MTEERKTTDPRAADDPRVSELYRDVARERAPYHLDQAVLRAAEQTARPRYWRLRIWTRPAAWAAVVLLSATLLLHVSQDEVPQDHARATGTAAPPQSEPVAELLEKAASQDADMLIRAEEMARMQQGPNEAPAASSAESIEEAVIVEAQAFSSRARADAAGPSCDADARSTPESWLGCIAEFEAAGLDDAAEQERKLLEEAFPDFETP